MVRRRTSNSSAGRDVKVEKKRDLRLRLWEELGGWEHSCGLEDGCWFWMQRFGSSRFQFWVGWIRWLRSWREDNQFIETGYRFVVWMILIEIFELTCWREASRSLVACFHSWTYIHNETGTKVYLLSMEYLVCSHFYPVNIYSHLIGAALFVALPLYLFKAEISPRYLIASAEDVVVCSIYFMGVAICFSLSAMFDGHPLRVTRNW